MCQLIMLPNQGRMNTDVISQTNSIRLIVVYWMIGTISLDRVDIRFATKFGFHLYTDFANIGYSLDTLILHK